MTNKAENLAWIWLNIWIYPSLKMWSFVSIFCPPFSFFPEVFIYSRYYSLVNYTYGKHVLPVSGLYFYFLFRTFWWMKVLTFTLANLPECVLIPQWCPTLCDPMDCSTPRFSALHHLLELAQTHVHWVSDAIQPSHPLSSPSPPTFNLSQH